MHWHWEKNNWIQEQCKFEILTDMESILTMGTSSILGETEEWEKAERKMLQQITSTRAKSLAYFEAKKGRKGKSGRNVIVTLKSALNIILAICFMQRQSRWRKELLKANEDCENKYESSRRRRKASEGRSVRILMKLPKQDPLSWITTIKPSKTGAQQSELIKSNFRLINPLK